MELFGSKFCPFYRALKLLSFERMFEFFSDDNYLKYLYMPLLIDNDRKMCGFLAVAEWITRFDTNKDMDRLWSFKLLTELWPLGASPVLSHRILRHIIADGTGYPDNVKVREARREVQRNLLNVNEYLQENMYLGEQFGASDALLAAMISLLDYVSEIDWSHYPDLGRWYMSIKGRPGFNFIIKSKIAGLAASTQYVQIDFM